MGEITVLYSSCYEICCFPSNGSSALNLFIALVMVLSMCAFQVNLRSIRIPKYSTVYLEYVYSRLLDVFVGEASSFREEYRLGLMRICFYLLPV